MYLQAPLHRRIVGHEMHTMYYSRDTFGYPVASAQQSCLQPVIASPQSSSKDGRATDSCFALIGAHECDVLMGDVG